MAYIQQKFILTVLEAEKCMTKALADSMASIESHLPGFQMAVFPPPRLKLEIHVLATYLLWILMDYYF